MPSCRSLMVQGQQFGNSWITSFYFYIQRVIIFTPGIGPESQFLRDTYYLSRFTGDCKTNRCCMCEWATSDLTSQVEILSSPNAIFSPNQISSPIQQPVTKDKIIRCRKTTGCPYVYVNQELFVIWIQEIIACWHIEYLTCNGCVDPLRFLSQEEFRKHYQGWNRWARSVLTVTAQALTDGGFRHFQPS